MQTKLEIQIHRTGHTIKDITALIASHNEGINLFLIKEVAAIIKGYVTTLPHSLKDQKLELIEDEGKINVYENGKDCTYTIQENHFYTLAMLDENNKDKHIAGEDALFLKEVPTYQRQKS